MRSVLQSSLRSMKKAAGNFTSYWRRLNLDQTPTPIAPTAVAAACHNAVPVREAMDAANEELVRRGLIPFEPGETRRNIVVEGIDVYALLNHEFCVGAIRLCGSDPTRPCRIPSAVAGKTGFAEAYRDRGGIRAEVLSDGTISIGDIIQTDLLPRK